MRGPSACKYTVLTEVGQELADVENEIVVYFHLISEYFQQVPIRGNAYSASVSKSQHSLHHLSSFVRIHRW